MSTTDQEARRKICPPSLGGDHTGVCCGSSCMAWRWSRAKETKAYLDAVQAHMKANNVGFNVATEKVWKELGSTFEQTEGYCGLAGTP